MAQGMFGADTESLRTLARDFRQAASGIESGASATLQEVRDVLWEGVDARLFRGDYDAFVAGAVRDLIDELGECDTRLVDQASAQDEASMAGGRAGGQPGMPDIDLAASVMNFAIGDDGFDPLHWIGGTLQNAGTWVWNNVGVPVVNGVASFGNALLSNPAAAITMLAGAGVVVAGACGATIGIALMPTGLVTAGGGTVVGAGITIGSGEIMAAGAALMGVSAMSVLGDAVDNPVQAVSEIAPEIYVPEGEAGNDPARPADEVLGELPKGKQDHVREVGSDAELQAKYDEMARGGEKFTRPGYPGEWVRQPDGTEIGIRNSSKSGGRTIDVRHPDKSPEKVHIK